MLQPDDYEIRETTFLLVGSGWKSESWDVQVSNVTKISSDRTIKNNAPVRFWFHDHIEDVA